MPQVRLCIAANAGGATKTTLCTEIAHRMGVLGFSVKIFDLDPQGSMSLFGGVEDAKYEESISYVMRGDFKGDYPFIKLWEEYDINNIALCRGSMDTADTTKALVLEARSGEILGDRIIHTYPVDADLILFDCPPTANLMVINAITAATHILIPLEMEPKSIEGVSIFFGWIVEKVIQPYRLNPPPQFIGLVPSKYDKGASEHRRAYEELKFFANQANINVFPEIRFSKEFPRASGLGLPMKIHRPKHPANEDFNVLIQHLSDIVGGK